MILQNISSKEIENFNELVRFLKRLADDGVTKLIEKQVIQMLNQSLPLFSHLVLEGHFEEIHRLTINKKVLGENKRIRDINLLKYPPKEKVTRYGRCNLPGQSILYSSIINVTALKELRPKRGDLITQAVWRCKTGERLKYCPIFMNQPPKSNTINPRTLEVNQLFQNIINQYPQNMRLLISTIGQFVADAFSKDVDSDNDLDYIFSAYFSDQILNHLDGGTIEAIYYPSVKEQLSFENLAIKPDVFDKKYYLYSVHDSVVISDKYGNFFMDGLSECKSFDYAGGKILWAETINQMPERLLEHKLNFGIDLE